MSHSYKINGRKVSQSVWNDCVQVLQKVDLQKAQKITEDNKVTDEEMNFILDRDGNGYLFHNDFKDYSTSLFTQLKSILKKHKFSGFELWNKRLLADFLPHNIPDQFWSDKEFVLFLAEENPWEVFSHADRYKDMPYAETIIQMAAKNDPGVALKRADKYLNLPYAYAVIEEALKKAAKSDPVAVLKYARYYQSYRAINIFSGVNAPNVSGVIEEAAKNATQRDLAATLAYADYYRNLSNGKAILEKAAKRAAEVEPRTAFFFRYIYENMPYANAVIEKAAKRAAEIDPDTLFENLKTFKDMPYAKAVIEKGAKKAVENRPDIALRLADHYKHMPFAKTVFEKVAKKEPVSFLNYIVNAFEKIPREKAAIAEIAIRRLEEVSPQKVFHYLGYFKDKPYTKSVLENIAQKYPKDVLSNAGKYKDMPYAKAVIEKAAMLDPVSGLERISEIAEIIEKNKNPVTKVILAIHESNLSHEFKLKLATLINEIVKKRMTIKRAVRICTNDSKFYRQLVLIKSQRNHIGSVSVDRSFKDLSLRMVLQINDLHNAHPSVRFKLVQNLKARDLYTLMVYAEEEIFTSTFNGLFDRLIRGMQTEGISGDRLLDMVGHDKFRTFIKLCAGFNRLNEFLRLMNVESRRKLLVEFVSNIDREKDSLFEAVNVADTFSMLKNSEILKVLQQSIKENYERVSSERDKESRILYGLLAGLFSKRAVINETWIKEMSKKYGLADLTTLSSEELFNPRGVNIQQHFFYNDGDGKSSFKSFINHYRRSRDWLIEETGNYVCIKSRMSNGKRIEIYANRPSYDGERDGVKEIGKLFSKKKIKPTVVVHRGHSYHVRKTISKIPLEAKIVSLGSCGGYSNISLVLKKAPRAHMLSTKGMGTSAVNDPLFKMLNDEILKGRSVNWPSFWKKASVRFRNKAFNDYVAPHRNLGAMFLKAYMKLVNSES